MVPQELVAEQVAAATKVSIPATGQWFGIGSGWGCEQETLSRRLQSRLIDQDATVLPRAADIARLAALMGPGVAAGSALPIYLRDQVVQRA